MKHKVWIVIVLCFMGMFPLYGDKKGTHYQDSLFVDNQSETVPLSSLEISTKKGQVLNITPLSWIPKKEVALSILSQDGTRLLTEGQSGLQLYDSQQGRHIQTFPKGRNIDVAALSSDGHTVIAGTKRFTTILNVWDAQSGQHLHTFNHFVKPVTFVGFHPQKPVIITSAEDIRLWDADTFDEVARLPLAEQEYAQAITWHDNRLLVAIVVEVNHENPRTSLIRIYDIDHHQEVSRFTTLRANQIGLSFIPNTAELVLHFARSEGSLLKPFTPPDLVKYIQIKNWKTGQLIFEVETLEPISSVFALPDGRHLLVSGLFGPLVGCQVWEIVKDEP